jgi:hypothetical protein
MKTFTKILMILFAFIVATHTADAQQQIQFEGLISQGEGIAGWNADGSGPEPYGYGHQVPAPGFGNQFYYGSSRDYITGNADHACAHFLPGSTGFPQFEKALADHGYLMHQVRIKYGLSSLGDDQEGIDWFFFNNYNYSNYYDVSFTFELDGQLLLAGLFDYANMYINTVSGNWQTESGYSHLQNVATDDIMIEIADAFLADLEGREIKVHYESTYGQQFIGNGRTGAYYNVLNGTLTKGNPEFPFQGLIADNEGTAGWNADGTGPEPYGNGHGTMVYYAASVDYDNINPDPDACLGHFLDNSTGFFNTLIQLEYRGYEVGDLKLKMGLCSLGPDVYGEDWGFENGVEWLNEYNNHFTFELDGEPILVCLLDTTKMVFFDPVVLRFSSGTSIGKVYGISGSASEGAQYVAQSLLIDLGTHYLKMEVEEMIYKGSFYGNGRSGVFYELVSAKMKGVHEQATFIPEGPVNGVWNMMGSPYFVDGNLTIDNGYNLTIQPGVKVAVRGPYNFLVNGSVHAAGTAEENILFTHSNPNLMWDGFGFDGQFADTNATSVFDRCIFEHALAQGPNHENSGGVFAAKNFSSFEIYNSTFRNNLANIDGSYPPSGGAIALWNSSPLIQNCTFYNNVAEYGGAILVYSYSSPVISNCLFYDNYAIHGGAISYYEYGNGVLINNTIADNSGDYGGALNFYWHSSPQIINNIIWGNSAVVGNQVYCNSIGPSYPGFYYNDIEGGQEGFHGGSYVEYLFNIDEDPAFVGDTDEFPYKIEQGSPCMDAGTPEDSAWFMPELLPETCICGAPRLYGDGIDMGAFEWNYVGLNSHEISEMPVLIYPNPVLENLNISVELEAPAVLSMQIYNTTGALVAGYDYGTLQAGKHLKTWNTSGLPDGIYYCRVQKGAQIATAKIIKLK